MLVLILQLLMRALTISGISTFKNELATAAESKLIVYCGVDAAGAQVHVLKS